MPTETIPELDLGVSQDVKWTDALALYLEADEPLRLVQVSVPVEAWPANPIWQSARAILLELRAENISPLLNLKKTDVILEDEELVGILEFLREQDQLTLKNFLELCEDWIPAPFQKAMRDEARVEAKWFQEWSMALVDPRIHKYPSLPYRSYLRKIVRENYTFATKFLELTASAATPEALKAVETYLNSFLEEKKRVVCLFPKNWAKGNA